QGQIEMRCCRIRFEMDRLAVMLDRGLRLSSLGQQKSEADVGVGKLRIKLNSSGQFEFGLSEKFSLGQSPSVIVMRGRVRRIAAERALEMIPCLLEVTLSAEECGQIIVRRRQARADLDGAAQRVAGLPVLSFSRESISQVHVDFRYF